MKEYNMVEKHEVKIVLYESRHSYKQRSNDEPAILQFTRRQQNSHNSLWSIYFIHPFDLLTFNKNMNDNFS